MWRSAESVIQATLNRPELTGQALIGEARRLDILTLDDAHALVALQGWSDRMRDDAEAQLQSAPTETERRVSSDALAALEHAVNIASRGVGQPAYASAPIAPAAVLPPPPSSKIAPTTKPWYTRVFAAAWVRVVTVIAIVAIAVGTWWVLTQVGKDYERGVAAYDRRVISRAEQSFKRAAAANPRDARPLVYLGRISREMGDLPVAHRWLDSAIRIAPDNAAAQRELGSLLLAEEKFELARRFYVRALELDPTDRLAQGFLACTLARLGRQEEAARWATRAGPGDWTPCIESSQSANATRDGVPLSPVPKTK